MKNGIAILALFAAIAALGVALTCGAPSASAPQTLAHKETSFERVMRTRTIRCAYAIWPPYSIRDPNTGMNSGINVEIMEAIGKVANLKIEWTEEVGYGSFPENLRAGKEDVFCSGAWRSVPRGQRVEYTAPIEYSALYAYVRADDTRFDNNARSLNDESVTFAVIEGSTVQAVAVASFPRARRYSLPENSDNGQAILGLATGKADAIVYDDFVIADYNKNNPDKKLRRVAGIDTLRTFGAAYAVGKGEWELRDLLNVALAELQGDGTVDRIIAKYEITPGAVLRVAKPYADQVHGGGP